MKNKLIIMLLLYVILTQTTYSQNTFRKTIDRSSFDVGFSVQQTNFGGYVIGGITEVNEEKQYLLAVTDEYGDTIFTRAYDKYNFFDAQLYAVQSNDNNYVLGPLFVSEDQQIERFCLFKTDTDGNELWTKTYSNDGSNSYGINFIETNDNGFLIAGMSNYKPFIVKTDSEGNKEWDKYFSDMEDAYAIDVVEIDDGFVIAGYSNIFTSGDFFIAKIDLSQNIVWNKTYPDAFAEAPILSLIKTSDNGFLISSCTLNVDKINSYLLKTNSDGDIIWSQTYNSDANSYINSTVETDNGDLFSVGVYEDCNSSSEEFYILKTTADGTFLSQQMIYDEEYHTGATDIAKTDDNRYIITGYKEYKSTNDWDVFLVKTDSECIISIKENPEIKYIINVYPNPADNFININLPENSKIVNISFTDITGKVVYSNIFKNKQQIKINLNSLNENFYLMKIETESITDTQKIIIN